MRSTPVRPRSLPGLLVLSAALSCGVTAAANAVEAAPLAKPRAARIEPAGSGSFAWTLGAHVGTPLGVSVSAAAIFGHAGGGGADGLVLLAQPGLGGVKLGAGYADIDGSAQGPYLIDRWRGWADSSTFIWAHRGWSARGVLLHTWGPKFGIDPDRTWIGAEGELIGSFGTDKPWGGLHGVNLTFGLLTNIDSDEHDKRWSSDDVDPFEEVRLVLELGVGF